MRVASSLEQVEQVRSQRVQMGPISGVGWRSNIDANIN